MPGIRSLRYNFGWLNNRTVDCDALTDARPADIGYFSDADEGEVSRESVSHLVECEPVVSPLVVQGYLPLKTLHQPVQPGT